jgi:hypothetical protein
MTERNHNLITRRRSRIHALAAGLLLGVVAAACNAAPSLVASPTPEPTAAATQPATESGRRDRDLLYALFDHREGVQPTAVRLAAETGNPGFIPPLVELTRFGFSDVERHALAEALTRLTGHEFDGSGFELFEETYVWLGNHPEIEPLPSYAAWKAGIYAHIDQRFHRFFYEGVPARVPLSGAQWGGVGVDGIPPLDNPKFLGSHDAHYLEHDDPVFGIVINGDARAYPQRILAWHEMSNDIVGGKPIALVY